MKKVLIRCKRARRLPKHPRNERRTFQGGRDGNRGHPRSLLICVLFDRESKEELNAIAGPAGPPPGPVGRTTGLRWRGCGCGRGCPMPRRPQRRASARARASRWRYRKKRGRSGFITPALRSMRRATVPLSARAPTCPRSAGFLAAARAAGKARGGGLRSGSSAEPWRARRPLDGMMRRRSRSAGNGECVASDARTGAAAVATVGVSQTVASGSRLAPASKKRGHLGDSKVGACEHPPCAGRLAAAHVEVGRGSLATQPPFDPWAPRSNSAWLPAGPAAARCWPSRRRGCRPRRPGSRRAVRSESGRRERRRRQQHQIGLARRERRLRLASALARCAG